MSLVILESHGNLGIVRLNNGSTNAVNLDMIQDLSGALDRVKMDFKGMVLTGGEKFFSIGFDLPELLKLDRKKMGEFFYKFNQVVFELLTLPVPTCAAVTAHAIAGGAILMLACDFRIAASGRVLIGLNEVKLGVPAPYLPDLVLRQIAGDQVASDMLYTGAFLDSTEAGRRGVIHNVLPKSEVETKALERVSEIASLPMKAFSAAKANRVESICKRYNDNFRARNEQFLDCWFNDNTQELLREAATKF